MKPTEGINIDEKALLLANMKKNGIPHESGYYFANDKVRLKIDIHARQFTSEIYREFPEQTSYVDYWQIAREDENYTDVYDILRKLHTDGLINKIYELEEEA